MAQMLADEKRRLMNQTNTCDRELTASTRAGAVLLDRNNPTAMNNNISTSIAVAPAAAAHPTGGDGGLVKATAKPPTPPPPLGSVTAQTARTGRAVSDNNRNGPKIEQQDVDALIADPRRVGALFHRLDTRHEGTVSLAALLQLYARSTCLHVVGTDDHLEIAEKRIRTVLREKTELNVAEFGAILMRMLQW